MSPIENHQRDIDLDRKGWPLYKKRMGIYPPWEQGLGGETGDSETDKPQASEPEDTSPGEDESQELEADGEDQGVDDDLGDFDDDFDDEEELDLPLDLPEPDEWEPEDELYLPPAPNVKKVLDDCDNRQFASWWEFVKSATDPSLIGWKGERNSREIDGVDFGWHGTKTWEQAVEMATRTGWPEGKRMLEDSLVVVRPKVEPFKSIEMSVAGAFPMVPNYAAGDPECMVVDPGADMRHSRPIVRIDYCNWTHSGVTPQDMMLRGAAVVSLAETLERHGYSTELRIVGNTGGGPKEFRYSIVYKQAGEYLDLDRTAFAIAHPATMRRLAFAILEQHPEVESAYHYTYGYPMYQPNDPSSGKPGGAIFIGPSRGGETVETARAAINEAAKELLDEINTAEESGSND